MTGGRAVSCDGTFAVDTVADDAPPAIVKDTPAAPNTGKAVIRRFRFEACFACAIAEPPMPTSKRSTSGTVLIALFVRIDQGNMQGRCRQNLER
jgi:hypothetical protein